MVAWVLFPKWLFILVALYLYFVPLSQAKTVMAPFFALLALCILQPAGWCFAAIVGALFLYTLLIKDLYLIDRKSAYEALSLVLMFLLLRIFYLDMIAHTGILPVLYAFIVAGLFTGLVGGFIGNFSPEGETTGTAAIATTQKTTRRVAVRIAFLLFFELIIIGLFLPLDFIYQSVVVFLLIAAIVELLPRYLFGTFSRTRLLTTFSVLFTLLVLVLGSARWEL